MAALDRLALRATMHCLAGCTIGEVAGMALGGGFKLGTGVTVALATALAFVFGYLLTLRPLVSGGVPIRRALGLAAASDTISIGIMEVVDNLVMLVIPGAMSSGPGAALFWASLAASLVLAGAAAFPVNRWLIARGKGHAVVHGAAHDAHAGHP